MKLSPAYITHSVKSGKSNNKNIKVHMDIHNALDMLTKE